MEKNFLSDVIPPADKKTIRDIPIPERRRTFKKSEVERKLSESEPEREVKNNSLNFQNFEKPKPKKKWKLKLLLGLVVLLIVFVGVASFFKSANISVEAKSAKASIKTQIAIAEKDSLETTENSLLFKAVELSETKSQLVKASGESTVQTKATGVITVYNEYSKTPQKLIANTRFEGKDGLIYRISANVNIPGYTEANGKKTPGQIDLKITADAVGDKYNTSSAEFTIPGFKSSPDMYKGFYAKTKSAISGGFDGIKKVVSENDRKEAEIKLKKDITSAILTKISEETDENTITIQSPDAFTFESLTDENVGNDVKISMTGTLKTQAFDKYSLSKAVAKEYLGDLLSDEKILISNMNSLDMSVQNDLLKVEGKADFVWKIDESALQKALAGVKAKDVTSAVKDFKGIQTITASISPFWFSTLPKDPEDINIKVQ